MPAEDEVSGGHSIPVGPLGIAQVEGIRLAVLADVVSLRQRRDGCAVGVHLHQAVGVVRNDLERGAVGGHLRVEGLNLGLQHDVQGAALCSASCRGRRRTGSGRSCHGAGRAAASRQSQCSRGDTRSRQEAAARNTTIEFHIYFFPSLDRFRAMPR